MHKHLLVIFCFLVFLTSCVPNRKILYLQKKDLHKVQQVDTIVRDYSLEAFDYKLQTNDLISVRYQSLTQKDFNVLAPQNLQGGQQVMQGANNPQLIGELVDDKGQIPMPVVGKVTVGGLTVFQAQDTLQKLANLYLEASIVKVRILNYHATVLGSVNLEGELTFNTNRVSLLEAIGMAGGLDDLADRANIKIVRQKNSKAEVFYVNILDENFVKSPFYYVHQNDVIIVPPLKQRPFRKYFGSNLAVVLSSISVVLLVITLNKK